jgi:hypothetical protein
VQWANDAGNDVTGPVLLWKSPNIANTEPQGEPIAIDVAHGERLNGCQFNTGQIPAAESFDLTTNTGRSVHFGVNGADHNLINKDGFEITDFRVVAAGQWLQAIKVMARPMATLPSTTKPQPLPAFTKWAADKKLPVEEWLKLGLLTVADFPKGD